jgi:hypothetical protein
MSEQQISEGLKILRKFFAMKVQTPEAPAIVEMTPVAPTLPQPAASLPEIQTPAFQPYEPIGRGRGPKILLTVIVLGLAGYFLNRKLKQRNKSEKDY